MALVLLRVAAGAYGLAALLGLFEVLRPHDSGAKRLLQALGGGMLIHAVALVAHAVTLGAFPVTGTLDGVSALAFLAAALVLAIAGRGDIPQLALFATPLIALLVGVASWGRAGGELSPDATHSALLRFHIGLALLGDAAFAVAGGVSCVYLVQERRLKLKRRPRHGTGLNQLPALEALDLVSVRLFKWGFPLMTLGLLSGMLYGKQVWGQYWTWDPRNMVSLLVWVLYAVMLHARIMSGWRGRKAAILTLVGVAAILLAMGLGLAGVGIHGRDYVSS